MKEIATFVENALRNMAIYRQGKLFSPLFDLLDTDSKPHRTKPGCFSTMVSVRNRGETAFQRAIYGSRKAIVDLQDGEQDEISWKDIELPVVFSRKARRNCIDLIGRGSKLGSFLCELKFDSDPSTGHAALADYAIFQSLLYYRNVALNYADLDREKVYRKPDDFRWKEVAESRMVMIIGNHNAWNKGLDQPHSERIGTLIQKVKIVLGVTVVFCEIPDYPFFSEDKVVDGKYAPAFRFQDQEFVPRLKVLEFGTQ